MALSLARHNLIEVQFSVLRAHLRLFTWLFFNLSVREQTLVSCFASLFRFAELTFGRMPILTRGSRTSTFQTVSARLSKNSASLTSASDAAFLDALLPRVTDGSEGGGKNGEDCGGFCVLQYTTQLSHVFH